MTCGLPQPQNHHQQILVVLFDGSVLEVLIEVLTKLALDGLVQTSLLVAEVHANQVGMSLWEFDDGATEHLILERPAHHQEGQHVR